MLELPVGEGTKLSDEHDLICWLEEQSLKSGDSVEDVVVITDLGKYLISCGNDTTHPNNLTTKSCFGRVSSSGTTRFRALVWITVNTNSKIYGRVHVINTRTVLLFF